MALATSLPITLGTWDEGTLEGLTAYLINGVFLGVDDTNSKDVYEVVIQTTLSDGSTVSTSGQVEVGTGATIFSATRTAFNISV
jgi:hypothetical protein